MTFEQIRILAATDWEQADEHAQTARPRVTLTGSIPARLIGVDEDGTAIVERAGWTAYWTVFEHLAAA
jgi:hypothetical protein